MGPGRSDCCPSVTGVTWRDDAVPWRVLRLVRTMRDDPRGTEQFDEWEVEALAAGDTIRIDSAPGARPVYGARLIGESAQTLADHPRTRHAEGHHTEQSREGDPDGTLTLGLPHRFEVGDQHRFALVCHSRERLDRCLHRPRLATARLSVQVAFAQRPRAVWAVAGYDPTGAEALSPALMVPPDGVVSFECVDLRPGQPYGLRWSFRAGQ